MLTGLVQDLIGSRGTLNIALSRVLAYQQGSAPERTAQVSLDSPPIDSSEVPAVLVIYLGQPQFQPMSGSTLSFAVNTDLPGDGSWQDVSQHVPGSPFATVPRVFTSAVPAELVVTDGPAQYQSIAGTQLRVVTNTDQQLFQDLADDHLYLLVAGRWFRTMNRNGPWTAAADSLPAEFARIPADGPQADVLASVPGTREAQDALLLAAVPHKSTVTRADVSLEVTYDGAPRFLPVDGTSMTYAVNTGYQVATADGSYYCCDQGVWFRAPSAGGPWSVCTELTDVIASTHPAARSTT